MRAIFFRSLGTLSLVLLLVLAACGGQEAAEEPTAAAEPTEATTEEEPTPEDEEEPTPEDEEEPTPEDETSADIPAGWQEVTSEEGNFSALMPGDPEEMSETIPTDIGDVEANFVQVATEEAAYQVVYSDYPEEMIANADIDEIFAGAINGALENIDGELVSEEVIDIDGNPGREFVAEAALEGISITYQGRYFLVENRLYQVFVVGDASSMAEEDITLFIDSFMLLDNGDMSQAPDEEPATTEDTGSEDTGS
ncbi:MAG: hypothetical protein HC828_18535, partial [Blastochloris sp.]|nr:hypothetical protein [Blastochloris sp.]